MISARHVSHSYDVGPAMIPALRSLTDEHANQVADAVQANAPDWETDRLHDCEGYLAVLVSLKDDMDAQPTYLISRTVQHIEVAEVHGDTLRELGPFDSLEQAIETLLVFLKPARRQ